MTGILPGFSQFSPGFSLVFRPFVRQKFPFAVELSGLNQSINCPANRRSPDVGKVRRDVFRIVERLMAAVINEIEHDRVDGDLALAQPANAFEKRARLALVPLSTALAHSPEIS